MELVTRGRTWGALAAVGAAAVLLAIALRPPRYTLLNASLRVDYPWSTTLAACATSVAVAAAAALVSRKLLRGALLIVAALAGLFAAGRARYRLEADNGALRLRELTGGTVLPWREVNRIDRGPAVIVVWGKGEAQVRIDTSGFREDQRATLDRSIARRVAEANAP
jgi:hypothetical protein